MDRREALRTTSFVVGYSLTASAIATALQGCRTEPATTESVAKEWSPAFFNAEQTELVAEMAETIIPETTTYGAKSVGVHEYIDDELQYFFAPQDQYKFLQGLADVQVRAQQAHDKTFQSCTAEERTALLQQMEVESKDVKPEDPTPFFTTFKRLAVRGYFTSEKVSKEVLNFDPVPGDYLGCIPLADVGRLWAL